MINSDQCLIQLKEVLDNLTTPENLNNHPWTKNRIVTEACTQNPELAKQAAGRQLVEAITQVFQKLQPVNPPRRGLRLDTRWGEFGLLASQYFMPYRLGLPQPATLKEAWQNIDHAILFFVFGNDGMASVEDQKRYQLISNEKGIAANSTISDWHRKGLEHLAEALISYEAMLESKTSQTSIHNPFWHKLSTWFSRVPRSVWKALTSLGIILLLVCLSWLGNKGWQIYQRVRSIEQNSKALLVLSRSFTEPDQLAEAGHMISVLRSDLQALQIESALILKAAPSLGWIPKYGGDLTQAPQLLEMGVQLSIAGDEAFQAVAPTISTSNNTGNSPRILDLLSSLKDGSTRLLAAQTALARARVARHSIQIDRLSPRVQTMLIEKIDPLLLSIQGAFPVDDVLAMARLAPRLLGAIGNGPQTYLIMVQNEDELRPTGGFLSAVGLLVIENGKVSNLSFESSDLLDDFSKPYPKAPWQLDRYMMAEMLTLPDANWFTDFPTTVDWVRFLYAYTRSQKTQGVITIDQHVIVELLRQVGPLQIEAVEESISADNVLQYMRSAKENNPPDGISRQTWNRKQFINRLATPLLKKLMTSDPNSLQALTRTMIQLLDEKHILLASDDPEMKGLLTRRGWDGAVRPQPNSDFLLVVDSNVGFNKTNAIIQITEDYHIDLTNLERPIATLTIKHTNNASGPMDCIQLRQPLPEENQAERDYRIKDCYWSYTRIYVPTRTEMITSTPHSIPSPWPLREQEIRARTDNLEEEIPGTQAYGTLLVVPIGQTLETSFTYRLPPAVVVYDQQNNSWIYRLKVQKQPGTIAIPLTIHIKLPLGMHLSNPPTGFQETPDGWSFDTTLQKDITLQTVFAPGGN